MSSKIDESIDCPACGLNQTSPLWESVNVTLNPELKEQLMRRELNKFVCTGCGHQAVIASNLLYHDMEKKFMIWMVPQDNGETPRNVDLDPALQKFGERYTLRMLGSYNALLEKIRILDDGMNDCFVELLKLVVEAQGENPSNKNLLYGGLREVGDEDPEQQILFLELQPNAPAMEYAIALSEVKSLIWKRFPEAVFHPRGDGYWPVVDRKYAAKCFDQVAP